MANYNLFTVKDPSFDPCPSCGKIATLRRSRTKNVKEWSIKNVFFYSYFRCRECGWRGRRSTIAFKVKSLRLIILYLVMAFIIGELIWFILNKLYH
jgi:predicted RNA-binding Zn-ribbon protein involved in translation (DUF1610 family)